jgi:arginyl-tRNA synthetase
MNIILAHNEISNWLSNRILQLYGLDDEPEVLEPENPQFGDFTTNVAFQLAKKVRKAPLSIAEEIVNSDLPECIKGADVTAGYINFSLSNDVISSIIRNLLSNPDDWRKLHTEKAKKIQVEFVSANPTGPLNIVSARAAAVGSTMANILGSAGHNVTTEFLLNDTGNQIHLLDNSFEARIAQIKGNEATIPENGYHGEYIKDYAAEYIESGTHVKPEKWILNKITSEQKQSLEKFRTHFDVWFSEKKFRRSGKIESIIQRLESLGTTYERDKATWFAASKFNSNIKDFVLIKSDGEWAYGLVDIAYHANKFEERGFDKVYTILGPDHYGHRDRLEASMKALGHEDKLKILILQQVNIIEGSEKVKMSKRAGKIITMDELIDDVGVDAARFFFLARRMEAHLDFDLDLARETSDVNPVYYVQYAHARIRSILKFAENKGLKIEEKINDIKFELAIEPEEILLIRKTIKFPLVVRNASIILGAHLIPFFLIEYSKLFHNFYTKHRVVGENRELSLTRLGISAAVADTIRWGLCLCGISTPNQM